MKMAKILNANYNHFIGVTPGCTKDTMLTFLWFDEDDRNTIYFNLSTILANIASDDKSVRYYDNENWSAHAPVGM